MQEQLRNQTGESILNAFMVKSQSKALDFGSIDTKRDLWYLG